MQSSKTGRKTTSVASAVWHVAPCCWNQMLPISSSSIFVNKSGSITITIAIDCNDLSLLIFEELCLWTKIRTKQWLALGASAFQCFLNFITGEMLSHQHYLLAFHNFNSYFHRIIAANSYFVFIVVFYFIWFHIFFPKFFQFDMI